VAEAVRWIARDSRPAARRLRVAIADLAGLLGEHPQLGTARPELADEPLRFGVVRGFPYLALFDPTTNPPVILRVLHGARDLPELLRDYRDEQPI
jgi:toxin ParE1/3/4